MKIHEFFIILILLAQAGCGGGSTDSEIIPADSPPNSSLPPVQTSCPTFSNPNIYPSFSPQYICGPTGIYTENVMNDINGFWGSGMYACSCSSDQPQCQSNALVYGNTPVEPGFGYIYFDATFLERLQIESNSFLPPAWLMSHEAGHNIQSAFYTTFPTPAFKELSADCLSGYFLGNLVCKGETNVQEINNVFNTLCSLEQGVSAFFNPNGHGSCAERVNSISLGINSYLSGVPPLSACL